jgi:hypothetical protein
VYPEADAAMACNLCRGPKAGRALFFGEGEDQGTQADLVFGGVTVITGEAWGGAVQALLLSVPDHVGAFLDSEDKGINTEHACMLLAWCPCMATADMHGICNLFVQVSWEALREV